MYGIDVLLKEHDNILRMANVMRKASLSVMNGGELVVSDFDAMVDYIRNYADAHHHGKEEKILFDFMKEELGRVAQNLITHGMLVEHDLGRLHIGELEQALRAYESGMEDAKLDVIVNATAYTYLIKRHIEKENAVVFTYGENNLKSESLTIINEKTKIFEEEAEKKELQKKYNTILEQLENKYEQR